MSHTSVFLGVTMYFPNVEMFLFPFSIEKGRIHDLGLVLCERQIVYFVSDGLRTQGRECLMEQCSYPKVSHLFSHFSFSV